MRDTKKHKRLYIFLDETGDPGHPDKPGASLLYQLNIVSTDFPGVTALLKHISGFRYFNDTGRELEKYHRSADKICEIFRTCYESYGVNFASFYVVKKDFIGPYLHQNNIKRSSYNPTYFKNYIVRKSLETLFSEVEIDTYTEIELIFDRYLDNEEEEMNLKRYLRNNRDLPNLLHITQVDSIYCEPVQSADYLGKIVKDSHLGSKTRQLLNFVHCFNLRFPDGAVKEKCPAAPMSTRH